MNNIERFLFQNPDAMKTFELANRDILQAIKERFESFFVEGDVVGKFLLCLALQGIVQFNAEREKALCLNELQTRGIGLMDESEARQ